MVPSAETSCVTECRFGPGTPKQCIKGSMIAENSDISDKCSQF